MGPIRLRTGRPEAFAKDRKAARAESDWKEHEGRLFQKIGQLEVELDWLKKKSEQLHR